ncbi:MAG: PAS domain S-box protein [Armatimonadota bacterium]
MKTRRSSEGLGTKDAAPETESGALSLVLRLSGSELSLEGLLDQTPAAIFIAEAPTGRVLYANRRATEIWGVTVAPSGSGSVQDYGDYPGFHRDGRRYSAEEWPLARAILHGETVAGEEIEILSGGARRIVRVDASPVRDADGRIVAGIVTSYDITEQRRAADQVRYLSQASQILSSSIDYRTTLSHVADLIVPHLADWCTVHVLEEDGTVLQAAVAHADPEKVRWAQEIQARYPYDPEASTGVANVLRTGKTESYPEITDEMLVAAAQSPEHLQLLREVGFSSVLIVPLRSGDRTLGVITLIAAESGYRYSETDIALVEELGARAGIAIENARLYRTAQQRSEDLRRTNSTLQALINGSPLALMILDEQGRVELWNPAAQRLYGWSPEEVLGQVLPTIPEDRQDEFRESLRRIFDGEQIIGLVTRNQRKDGSPLDVSVWWVALTDADGSTRCLRIVEDISERVRADEELRMQAQVLESMTEGVSVTDESGVILYTNPAEDVMFGYERGELIGQRVTVQNAYPPEENERRVAAVIDELKRGHSWFGEWLNRRKDGSTFFTYARITALELAGRRYWICVQEDVTERKRAADALRDSEERFRQIAESIHEVFYVLDPWEPRVLYVSPAFEAVWGRPWETLYETPGSLLEAIHPEDHRSVAGLLARLRSGERTEAEYRIVRPDGEIRWLLDRAFPIRDAEGRVTRVTGAATDITERRQTDETLRREHALRKTIEASMLAGVAATDLEGVQTYVNPAFCRMLGWSEEELLGCRAPYRYWPPEELERIEATFRDTLAGQVPPTGFELRFRRADEERVDVLVLPSALRNPAGEITGWLASVHDITHQKRLEADLRERAEQLAEADRRKNEFLAMLAHELRNPLGALRSALQVLRLSSPEQAAFQRALAVAGRQLQQQTRMVEDLLDVSRITRGRLQIVREPVDLAAVVRDTAEDARSGIEAAGLTLSVELPEGPLLVEGDPVRLGQILVNLLSNAVKFTDPGGRIEVRLEREDADAVLRVRDTGVGIAPELLPRIFQSFTQAEQTLDRSRGGLGLGLALVRGIAELHGGTAHARSEGDRRGSELVVCLPLSPQAADEELPDSADAAGEARSSSRFGPRRVLLIEDNADVAATLRDVLELWGYEVEIAATGPAGLEAARRGAYGVILCDIGLPGLDGYGVARALRAEPATAATPLFAVSGYSQDADRRQAEEAGFDLHLAKPVDPVRLRELLEKALHRRDGGGSPCEASS